MLKRMFISIMLALFSLSASAASDNQSENLSNEFERAAICYDYHYDPHTCSRLWYCEYDYYSNTCNYVDDNDGDGRSCSYYDRDPRGCDRQENCRWDRRANRCEDRYDPSPSYCSYYYDWRSCDAVQECFWDRRLNRCVDARR
jgi:hypothetical protein